VRVADRAASRKQTRENPEHGHPGGSKSL
jgi:hypothetical protein